MTFDLATAKARLNIPVVDVTKDASVQLSLDTALALAMALPPFAVSVPALMVVAPV